MIACLNKKNSINNHIGLLVTIGMMTVKGTYQVIGKTVPASFPGFAGMGHTAMLALPIT
jgi:hypothetical protein